MIRSCPSAGRAGVLPWQLARKKNGGSAPSPPRRRPVTRRGIATQYLEAFVVLEDQGARCAMAGEVDPARLRAWLTVSTEIIQTFQVRSRSVDSGRSGRTLFEELSAS